MNNQGKLEQLIETHGRILLYREGEGVVIDLSDKAKYVTIHAKSLEEAVDFAWKSHQARLEKATVRSRGT